MFEYMLACLTTGLGLLIFTWSSQVLPTVLGLGLALGGAYCVGDSIDKTLAANKLMQTITKPKRNFLRNVKRDLTITATLLSGFMLTVYASLCYW